MHVDDGLSYTSLIVKVLLAPWLVLLRILLFAK
jgi:hypothetical protein